MAALKVVQAALGDWHDLYQWCQQASRETDLQPLLAGWQLCASKALAAADVPLHRLARQLAKQH
jgi:CHAD domain-containing protein